MRCDGKNRFRSASLGAAAATLAGTGASAPASAAVISDLTQSYGVGESFQVNGDISGEIELVAQSGMMGDFLSLDSPAGTGMGMAPGSDVELAIFSVGMAEYLELLSPGDTVDGSLSFDGEGFLLFQSNPNPSWLAGTTGYAGFRFDDGSGMVYGWLQVEFDASGTDFSVHQWAYNDTGAPITAASTPEPSTALLLLLGLSGLVVAGGRQRDRGARAARRGG